MKLFGAHLLSWLVCLSVVSMVAVSPVRAAPSSSSDRPSERGDTSGDREGESDQRRLPVEPLLSIPREYSEWGESQLNLSAIRLDEVFRAELYGAIVMLNWMERYVQRAPIEFTRYGPGLKLRPRTLEDTSQSVRLLKSVVLGWGFASVRFSF